jgi:hypothetical protein
MNFDQWPLAEAFVEDAAQSSARRVAHGFVVAAQATRQLVERALDCAAQRRSRRLGSGRPIMLIVGGAKGWPRRSSTKVATAVPLKVARRRSLSAVPSSGNRPLPSLASRPTGTSSTMLAPLGASRTMSPF